MKCNMCSDTHGAVSLRVLLALLKALHDIKTGCAVKSLAVSDAGVFL